MGWRVGWLVGLVGWVVWVGCLVAWLVGCVCCIGWLVVVDFLVCWLVGWLAYLDMVGWLACWCVGWVALCCIVGLLLVMCLLANCLVGWVGLLVGWWFGWLVGLWVGCWEQWCVFDAWLSVALCCNSCWAFQMVVAGIHDGEAWIHSCLQNHCCTCNMQAGNISQPLPWMNVQRTSMQKKLSPPAVYICNPRNNVTIIDT